ncbi:7029_t:CDS:2 [Diversispora eburnea]|uniref:7029_t:CDS:1 n=1 Tax=Diversispora eburnea TaxID=1213867 RepID=A0A9N9B069_9GLOM|nr:7029_t:CDS:2 [Diversispora eburnea]
MHCLIPGAVTGNDQITTSSTNTAINADHSHLTNAKVIRQISDMWKNGTEEVRGPQVIQQIKQYLEKSTDSAVSQLTMNKNNGFSMQSSSSIICLHKYAIIDIPNPKILLLTSHFTDNPKEFVNSPDQMQLRENEFVNNKYEKSILRYEDFNNSNIIIKVILTIFNSHLLTSFHHGKRYTHYQTVVSSQCAQRHDSKNDPHITLTGSVSSVTIFTPK